MGMYVHGFEGSWFDHPFWRAGFTVTDERKLAKIRESAVAGVIVEMADEPKAQSRSASPAKPSRASPMAGHHAPQVMIRANEARESREDIELEQAKHVMKRARTVIIRVFDQARLGRAIHASDVAAVVDEVSDAVMRNPSAMVKVARLKSKNEYTYMHSVAVCTLMVNFARTLNLPESSYRPLGLAGLLHDVGKLTIADDILEKPGSLTSAEFEEIKMHTIRGRELIADSTDVPEAAIDVCLHHHERINGTGYPFGLSAEQISLHARMGGICDIYDALTSDRVYKSGWQPIDALTGMTSWQGHLDPDLLFQFQRSIGIYVPGTLVELRSRRLGIILPAGKRSAAMKARVFYCPQDRDFIEPVDIKLGESLRYDQPMRQADPDRWGFRDWNVLKTAILAGDDPRHLADRWEPFANAPNQAEAD